MNGLTKALAAEFTGTFALIFLGAGAATVLGSEVAGNCACAWALLIMVSQCVRRHQRLPHQSGVTVGLAVAGEFPRRRVAPSLPRSGRRYRGVRLIVSVWRAGKPSWRHARGHTSHYLRWCLRP